MFDSCWIKFLPPGPKFYFCYILISRYWSIREKVAKIWRWERNGLASHILDKKKFDFYNNEFISEKRVQ